MFLFCLPRSSCSLYPAARPLDAGAALFAIVKRGERDSRNGVGAKFKRDQRVEPTAER